MNTIKQDPVLRYGTSGFTIKEAYMAPESETLEIKLSRPLLEGSGEGTGTGDDWGNGGGD